MTAADPGADLAVGVIGTGVLGQYVGAQFAPIRDAAVVALADVSDRAREEAGERLDVPEGARYPSHGGMLDGESLDAVVIATPHALHDEQITAALDRGLDVLCEKPLVLDTKRARALADRVAGARQVLMVGYQRHQDLAYHRARERCAADGREPRFITASITQDWFAAFGDTWRTDPELSGGGFLVDTGRHVVDAVLWMTGLRPVAVTAALGFEEPGVDREGTLRIEFANGAIATIALHGDVTRVRESISIHGVDGAAIVEGLEWGGRCLTVLTDGTEACEPYLDRSSERTKAEAFVDSIREGTQPPATPWDAVRTTAVVNAAYEAAEAGERVELPRDLGVAAGPGETPDIG